jgi:APA family basic amino acid/polyamine antiporter
MWFGIAAAIGNTIAAGIVAAQGYIAAQLPNVWLFLGVWIVGGLYALFGASSLAELGAAIPRSGGQYNYSRRALGEYAGFIVGWSDWISTCGTNAVVALVIGNYTGVLFPALAGRDATIAVFILLGFAVLQWRGIKWGSAAQLVTAALKTGAFLVLVFACFVFGESSHAAAVAVSRPLPLASGWLLATAFMLALQKVIYTVDGWDGVIYFGEEVKNPSRDVPRAIFGSVFSIIAIYLLLSAAVAYVLPMKEIVGNGFALGTAATRIFGPYGDPVIRSIMLISLLSCINACLLFSTRTLYAMSGDGLFFRAAARVKSRRDAGAGHGVKHAGRHLLLCLPKVHSRHRHAGVFLCCELYAFLHLHFSLAGRRTGTFAPVSRLGLPVDDRYRPDRVLLFWRAHFTPIA